MTEERAEYKALDGIIEGTLSISEMLSNYANELDITYDRICQAQEALAKLFEQWQPRDLLGRIDDTQKALGLIGQTFGDARKEHELVKEHFHQQLEIAELDWLKRYGEETVDPASGRKNADYTRRRARDAARRDVSIQALADEYERARAHLIDAELAYDVIKRKLNAQIAEANLMAAAIGVTGGTYHGNNRKQQ